MTAIEYKTEFSSNNMHTVFIRIVSQNSNIVVWAIAASPLVVTTPIMNCTSGALFKKRSFVMISTACVQPRPQFLLWTPAKYLLYRSNQLRIVFLINHLDVMRTEACTFCTIYAMQASLINNLIRYTTNGCRGMECDAYNHIDILKTKVSSIAITSRISRAMLMEMVTISEVEICVILLCIVSRCSRLSLWSSWKSHMHTGRIRTALLIG